MRVLISILLILSALFGKHQINSSMVISGGVSLGAYEAGYNWGIINLIKKVNRSSPKVRIELKSLSGASAGSINALISAIYWCQENDNYFNSVDKNLFFNTWVEIDYNDLIIKKEHPTNKTTLFKRDALIKKANRIISHMNKRVYKRGCKIPLGVTVTKVNPIIEEYRGIKIKNQSFGIPLEVYERGRRLKIKNLKINSKLYTLSIPNIEKRVSLIKDVLFASSAFPGAFEQVRLRYRYKGKIDSDYFIDGGVYNNIPLDLAIALGKGANTFFFIDPDNIRDNSCKYAPKRCKCRSLINHKFKKKREEKYNSGFLGSNLLPFIEANEIFRSMKLYETIKNYFLFSNKDRELILSSRYHPITGYFLWHFGAFLDRNFREYDYYVGVYDAIYKMAEASINRGFNKDKNLVDVMKRYKRLLGLKGDSEVVFDMLLDIEFCGKYPKTNNKYSAIFRAFNLKTYQNQRYSFDEFKSFIKRLKSNYLDINRDSFLAYAIKNKDSWHKRLARDFISRVTYLENQKAEVDPSYEKIAKAVNFGAWISMSYLKERDSELEIQPLLIPPDEEDTFYYKLFPTEFAIDTVNGGFSLGYSAVLYGDFLTFDGVEMKLNLVTSKHIDNHLRLDVDPFVEFDNGIKAGAGVSLFGNIERGKFWDRDRGLGVNAFIDYNDIFRFTYVKSVDKRRQDFFFFGIRNIPSLFYWLNK
jgi:predicted acylesterase/phospholipase RssA